MAAAAGRRWRALRALRRLRRARPVLLAPRHLGAGRDDLPLRSFYSLFFPPISTGVRVRMDATLWSLVLASDVEPWPTIGSQ